MLPPGWLIDDPSPSPSPLRRRGESGPVATHEIRGVFTRIPYNRKL